MTEIRSQATALPVVQGVGRTLTASLTFTNDVGEPLVVASSSVVALIDRFDGPVVLPVTQVSANSVRITATSDLVGTKARVDSWHLSVSGERWFTAPWEITADGTDIPDVLDFTFSPTTEVSVQVSVLGSTESGTGSGASAYEVALSEGFVGTEAEWLASLVGPPGTDATVTTESVSGVGAVMDSDIGTTVEPAGAADAAQAFAIQRGNHSGVQPSSTIEDFAEAVQDAVAALLGAGSNIVLNYDDVNDTLTIESTASGDTGLDEEAVRDAIGIALIGAGIISVAVNDAADTITISTTATQNSTDAALRDRGTHTGVQEITTITGLQAALDAKETPAGAQAKADAAQTAAEATAAAALASETAARTDADTALDGRLDTVEATLPDKADLIGGVIPTAQLPAISIMERVPVADEAARLLLANPGDVQIGDVAVQVDTGTTWLLVADDPSLAGSWKAIDQSDAVSSVNGQTGTVVLGKADVGLGNVDNTADLSKPVSTAQQTALDAKANDADVVKLTGAQTVAGTKTFSVSPVVPAPTTDLQASTKKYVDDTVQNATSDLATVATTGEYADLLNKPDLGAYLTQVAAPELVRDTMGTALVAGSNVTITPDDAGDSITIASTASGGLTAGQALTWEKKSGLYYPPIAATGGGTIVMTNERLLYLPIWLPNCTLDRIGIRITGAGSGGTGSVIRLGLYASDGAGTPAARVIDAGTIDSTTTGTKEITISQVVTSGLHFIAVVAQGATTQPTVIQTVASNLVSSILGLNSADGGPNAIGYGQTGVSGALPSPAAPTFIEAVNGPRPTVRLA